MVNVDTVKGDASYNNSIVRAAWVAISPLTLATVLYTGNIAYLASQSPSSSSVVADQEVISAQKTLYTLQTIRDSIRPSFAYEPPKVKSALDTAFLPQKATKDSLDVAITLLKEDIVSLKQSPDYIAYRAHADSLTRLVLEEAIVLPSLLFVGGLGYAIYYSRKRKQRRAALDQLASHPVQSNIQP